VSRDHERALAAFERDLVRRGRARATKALLLSTARAFLASVAKPVRRIKPRHVREYLATREKKGLAPLTLARDASTLRVFFEALVTAELLAASPAEGLETRRARPRRQLVLGGEDVERLLAAGSAPGSKRWRTSAALGLRNRACLELLYGLGLRRSEVCAVHVVDLSDGLLRVRPAKRGPPRFLPIPPRSLAALEAYLRDGRPVLARRRDAGTLLLTRNGRRFTGPEVTMVVRDAAKRAGIKAHPHAFRRALATGLVREGANVTAVQFLLGHERLETTAGYVAYDREDLRRAVSVLERN
jgi:integrase/recombinase XerD